MRQEWASIGPTSRLRLILGKLFRGAVQDSCLAFDDGMIAPSACCAAEKPLYEPGVSNTWQTGNISCGTAGLSH